MKRLFIIISCILFWMPPGQAQTQDNDTLEIVNWNLEYFGDNSWQLPQEMDKTRTIMNALNADAYALVEVVNTDSLYSLVNSLDGNYNYLLSSYGSFASGPTDPDYVDAQKLALIYRTSMFRNLSSKALLKSSTTAYGNWASGRYPYLVSCEVKGADNNWYGMKFVILHAKAGSDGNSCSRRLDACREMKDSLDMYYPGDRIIITGDFNDDFDQTICSSGISNYDRLIKDSTDNNSYSCPTLPLSVAGQASIDGYNSFLDHVVLSNELKAAYVPGSAQMLESKVNNLVTDYTNDVSDHFPVMTKYILNSTTSIISNKAWPSISIFPNPASNRLYLKGEVSGIENMAILDAVGRQLHHSQKGTSSIDISDLANGMYYLQLQKGGTLISLRFTVVH